MVIIAIVGLAYGRPESLVYGTDYQGSTCGSSGTAGSFIYYPKLTEDLAAAAASGQTDITSMSFFGMCMDACPSMGDVVCTTDGKVALAQYVTRSGRRVPRLLERAWLTSLLTSSLEHYYYCQSPICWRKRTQLSSTDAGAYFACDDVSEWVLDSICKTVHTECWYVPMPTQSYFYRCLWMQEESQNSTEVCLSPPDLAGKVWSEMTTAEQDTCVTSRTIVTTMTEGEANSNPLIEQMASTLATVSRLAGDVSKTMVPILVCGVLVAGIAAFVWLVLVRYFVKPMVWCTLALCVLLLVIATLLSFIKAGMVSNSVISAATSAVSPAGATVVVPDTLQAGDDSDYWKAAAYVLAVLTLLVLFVVIAYRKRIKLAVALLKEASSAIRSMPGLMLVPLVSAVAVLVLTAYWLGISAYVYTVSSDGLAAAVSSVSELTAGTALANSLCGVSNSSAALNASACTLPLSMTVYEQDVGLNSVMLVYHFFGFLWTNQFIWGMSVLVIAGAVSQFYFSPDRKAGLKQPTLGAAWRAVRYHSGSVAFGALLIAIIQFLRVVLEYVDRKTKRLQDSNKVVKFLMACLRCCLWCFEKVVKFITKYAFVYVAMRGESFMTAARHSVGLILSYAPTIAIVEGISAVLFALSKLMIVSATIIVAYLWIDNAAEFQAGGSSPLQSMFLPMLVTALLAYATASSVLALYNIAVDTLLASYCVDRDMNNGADKPYYMSDTLAAVLSSGARTRGSGGSAAGSAAAVKVIAVSEPVVQGEPAGVL